MQNTFIVKIWQKLPPKKSQIKTCPNLRVDLKGPTKYKERSKIITLGFIWEQLKQLLLLYHEITTAFNRGHYNSIF